MMALHDAVLPTRIDPEIIIAGRISWNLAAVGLSGSRRCEPVHATGRYFPGLSAWIGGLLLLFLLCGCGGGSSSGSPGKSTVLPPAPMYRSSLDDVRDRVIVKFPVGSYVGQPDTRNISRNLPELGWDGSGFVEGAVWMLNYHGLHRADLHNPFGRLDGEKFQLDQYLEALQLPGLKNVTDTFVSAWSKWLAPATGNGNMEIIGYVGSPRNDPDSHDVAAGQGLDAFMERTDKALAPFLATGMSVGLDNSTIGGKQGFTYYLAEDLRQRGVKVYVEALPLADNDWWLDYPILIREYLWQERQYDPAYVSREELRNELIRYPKIDRNWAKENPDDTWPEVMCRIISQGDTLMVEDYMLRWPYQNRTIQGLVDCANALAEDSDSSVGTAVGTG